MEQGLKYMYKRQQQKRKKTPDSFDAHVHFFDEISSFSGFVFQQLGNGK